MDKKPYINQKKYYWSGKGKLRRSIMYYLENYDIPNELIEDMEDLEKTISTIKKYINLEKEKQKINILMEYIIKENGE